jgi:hypothetical protein
MADPLYKSVLLRMSPDKFLEHKRAKGEQQWEEYFEVEKVRNGPMATGH